MLAMLMRAVDLLASPCENERGRISCMEPLAESKTFDVNTASRTWAAPGAGCRSTSNCSDAASAFDCP